jgi:hypothetical protein
MNNSTHIGLVLSVILGSLVSFKPLIAETNAAPKQRPILLYIAGDLGMASPDSDKVVNAVYTKKMQSPEVVALGLGARVAESLWLGVRYEKWFEARTLNLGSGDQTDTLNLSELGPEVAYVRGNSRVDYLFAVGGMYPLTQTVSSSTGALYNRGSQYWNYHGRFAMEMRLSSRLGLHFEAGYRWVNLRDLQSQGTSFISGGGNLNLSGPFVGIGLTGFFDQFNFWGGS